VQASCPTCLLGLVMGDHMIVTIVKYLTTSKFSPNNYMFCTILHLYSAPLVSSRVDASSTTACLSQACAQTTARPRRRARTRSLDPAESFPSPLSHNNTSQGNKVESLSCHSHLFTLLGIRGYRARFTVRVTNATGHTNSKKTLTIYAQEQ